MTYATEFPQQANDTACAAAAGWAGWDDVSWHNDASPSFQCDVVRLFCDHEDVGEREMESARYVILEGEEDFVGLVSECWADVLAYVNDGKRHFAEFHGAHDLESFARTYEAWMEHEGIPEDKRGSADEMAVDMLAEGWGTPYQRAWLADFIRAWDRLAARPTVTGV